MEPWQLIDWLVELEETQGKSSQITDTNEGREPHISEQRTTERLVKKSEAPKKRGKTGRAKQNHHPMRLH